jgi:multiple sugar transport system substrate-binding protein
MKSRWGGRALLVAVLLLVAFFGFAQTTLRVTTWAGAEETALDEAIIAEFMRQNPEYRVVYEPVPGGQYYQKILTDIGAGTPPDVILLDAEMIPLYAESGYLTDLSPFLARLNREGAPGANTNEYFPVLVNIFRSGRSQLAIPKDTSPIGIFYNKKVFDEAGVPHPPAEGWTMEEFRETAQRLSRDTNGDGQTDVWGFGFPSWVGVVVPIFWANGGEVFNPDFTQVSGYLNSARNVATYNAFLEMLEQGFAPTPQEASALGGAAALFYTDKIGMTITGRWFNVSVRGQIARGADLQVGATTLPFADMGSKATVTYASGWAVPANVVDKVGAARLAAFLSSEYAQTARCLEGGLAIAAIRSIAEQQAARDPMDAVFISMLDYARVPVGSQTKFYRPKFETTWAEAFDRINVGGETAEQAMEWAARQMDEFIRRGEH